MATTASSFITSESTNLLEQGLTAAVRDMTLGSQHLTRVAGGQDEVLRMLNKIENVWLKHNGEHVHLDLHAADHPKATVVFQPGSGAHARVYFLLGGLLARRGYNVLAIDRPGHGLSDGARGDCTVEQAIAVAAATIDYARVEFRRPVVLMGSSMGGLLTIFALLKGLQPDLAVAHNFVYPGKLLTLRLRSWWINRFRTRPYPLSELVHGLKNLSGDPSINHYLGSRSDPGMAWELTSRSVASLFGFNMQGPKSNPRTLVITGARDRAIPAWATRGFTRWSGLRNYEIKVIPNAGHLLFHDHLDEAVPLVSDWLDARLKA